MQRSVPDTRPSLIARLKDAADVEAWREFSSLYCPVIFRYAKGKRMQDADAEDLTQEVLRALVPSAHRYEELGIPFRKWLFGIVRNKYLTFVEKLGRDRTVTSSQKCEHWDCSDDSELFELEYQRQILWLAADAIRHEFSDLVWEAFWQTAVAGEEPAKVSQALGVSRGSVYVYKSRVMLRLKSVAQSLHQE